MSDMAPVVKTGQRAMENVMTRLLQSTKAKTLGAAFAVTSIVTVAPAEAATCGSLARLVLPDTTFTSAATVTSGSYTPPGTTTPLDVPAFCRVEGVIEPAVRFEVWLPMDGWNGKFHVSGNGGMAGVISYGGMASALNRGYAAASTDTGHVRPGTGGFDASWAIGRPDLVADFGHRALHVTAEAGKAITRGYYERAPDYAYYAGCSKGGQQGLMSAQRYPDDFNGIIAGDPAHDWTRFYAGAHLWYALATLRDPESYIPRAKLPLLADAVNNACDALDGLEDGVIDDPRTCDVDPAILTCRDGQPASSCFTPKQVEAVRTIWAGSRDAAGDVIYPGLVPGGENGPGGGWGAWVTGADPFTSLHWLAADGFFKYMVFEEPDWNFRTFDYHTDLEYALDKVGPSLDAADPDLRELRDGGAKLIVYHGWSDPDISPLGSIDYYEDVLSVIGGDRGRDVGLTETRDFFRLFMVPGMGHCSGGPGYNSLDALPALEAWVEDGIAPDTILGSRIEDGEVVRTRPLCAYPETASWDGDGDPNDASSFACRNER